jgi:hypothetical protein
MTGGDLLITIEPSRQARQPCMVKNHDTRLHIISLRDGMQYDDCLIYRGKHLR